MTRLGRFLAWCEARHARNVAKSRKRDVMRAIAHELKTAAKTNKGAGE